MLQTNQELISSNYFVFVPKHPDWLKKTIEGHIDLYYRLVRLFSEQAKGNRLDLTLEGIRASDKKMPQAGVCDLSPLFTQKLIEQSASIKEFGTAPRINSIPLSYNKKNLDEYREERRIVIPNIGSLYLLGDANIPEIKIVTIFQTNGKNYLHIEGPEHSKDQMKIFADWRKMNRPGGKSIKEQANDFQAWRNRKLANQKAAQTN